MMEIHYLENEGFWQDQVSFESRIIRLCPSRFVDQVGKQVEFPHFLLASEKN